MPQHIQADPDRGPARAAVVVLGSLNMDLSVTVNALPRPGETVLAERISRQPGGKGANQAIAAARLGADVCLIGLLGNDDLAAQIRGVLDAARVNTRHVRTVETATGQAFVTVDARGENAIVVASGANAQITRAAVDEEAGALRAARIAVAQLETPLAAVERFAAHCNTFGVDVLLNAAPYRPVTLELLGRCRYLVLNRDEASAMTGVTVTDRASAIEAALAAQAFGVENVVITLGGDGCVAVAGTELLELDAFEVPVVDTTGAGDAFVGALAMALADDRDFGQALTFAAAAGATACAGVGAQSITSPDETNRLLEEQQRVVSRRPVAVLDHTTPATHR